MSALQRIVEEHYQKTEKKPNGKLTVLKEVTDSKIETVFDGNAGYITNFVVMRILAENIEKLAMSKRKVL